MKKIISVIFAALLAIPFFCKASSAAAPPKKDGVVFSGSVSSGKRIALTFDDGPHPTKTKEILDILDKYDVKATFFIIGVNAERYPEIIADEAARGHELANHSYSHKNLSKICDDKIKEEIEKTDEIIEKAANITPKLFRPPTGAYSESIVKVAKEFGKTTIIWTVDTLDWANAPKDDIVKNIKSNIQNGSIILFHDFTGKESHTKEALDTIIPYLKEQGYEFVTVSELIEDPSDQ